MAAKFNMFEAIKALFKGELIQFGVWYTELQIAHLLAKLYPNIGFEFDLLKPDFQKGRLKTLRGALNDMVWRDAEGVWALRRGARHGWGLLIPTDTRPRMFRRGVPEYRDPDLPLDDGFDDAHVEFIVHAKGRKRADYKGPDRDRRITRCKVEIFSLMNGVCAACGHEIPTPMHAELDHELSFYMGEKTGVEVDVPANVYVVHGCCNRVKSKHRNYGETQAALLAKDPPMTTAWHIERARRARADRQRKQIKL